MPLNKDQHLKDLSQLSKNWKNNSKLKLIFNKYIIGLMAENNRLKNLNGTINAFKQIMAAVRGEVPCEITTAKV